MNGLISLDKTYVANTYNRFPVEIVSGKGSVVVDNNKVYKDVLIYKDGYKFSELDKKFITALCESKRKHLNNEISKTRQ